MEVEKKDNSFAKFLVEIYRCHKYVGVAKMLKSLEFTVHYFCREKVWSCSSVLC